MNHESKEERGNPWVPGLCSFSFSPSILKSPPPFSSQSWYLSPLSFRALGLLHAVQCCDRHCCALRLSILAETLLSSRRPASSHHVTRGTPLGGERSSTKCRRDLIMISKLSLVHYRLKPIFICHHLLSTSPAMQNNQNGQEHGQTL